MKEEQRQRQEEQQEEQPTTTAQRYDGTSFKQQQQQRIYLFVDTNKSDKTKVQYLRYFNHFLDFIKIHDLQVLLDFSPKVIKQMIIDYILYLRDEKPGKKLGKSSIKAHICAILYFFQINNDDFNLTLRKFNIHLPSDDRSVFNEDRPYTRDEIAQIIQKGCSSDLRSNVVIYLLCGSGLRMGAISSIRIEDLIPMEYKGLNVYKVKVYARTHDEYYTFTTVDSAKAIRDYLDYRERCHEKLTEKSPLIREQFNKDNPFTVNAPRSVTDKAIEYLIDQVITRSGVRKPGVIHLSHGMRKFFVSQCESSPMKSLHVSMLSGHTTGIKKPYYKPNDSILLEDFMLNACDALTISPEHRQKRRIDELESERSQEMIELRALKKEMDGIKSLLGFSKKPTALLNHLEQEAWRQIETECEPELQD